MSEKCEKCFIKRFSESLVDYLYKEDCHGCQHLNVFTTMSIFLYHVSKSIVMKMAKQEFDMLFAKEENEEVYEQPEKV